MTALALDDEWPALAILEAFCKRLDGLHLLKTFTKPGEARLFLANHPVDLLLLDINLPNETGLHFARTINFPCLVVFTTAYSEHALESYEVPAVDYLLKPFTFERFAQAVQRAQAQLTANEAVAAFNQTESVALYLQSDHGVVKVMLNELLFVEGLDNYLKIHLLGDRTLVLRLTLKALLDKLPTSNFVRVHRSYIVALDKIEVVRSKLIRIGEEEIPIGSSYEKEFSARFTA